MTNVVAKPLKQMHTKANLHIKIRPPNAFNFGEILIYLVSWNVCIPNVKQNNMEDAQLVRIQYIPV